MLTSEHYTPDIKTIEMCLTKKFYRPLALISHDGHYALIKLHFNKICEDLKNMSEKSLDIILFFKRLGYQFWNASRLYIFQEACEYILETESYMSPLTYCDNP